MSTNLTTGVHHVGLTVSRLEESAQFFTAILGWKEVKRKEEYPAIFVSDGSVLITLWKTRDEPVGSFDRNRNVGLHHLAIGVVSEADLLAVFEKMVEHKIDIEFAPELLGQGPAKHMMCYDPSGIRIEFIWPAS